MMNIEILEFVEGAKRSKGITVIIDVFRAFSVSCYAYDAGAARVITTADVNEAFRLKEKYSDSILAGERQEKKIEGFDIGNSPTEILKTDMKGKTLIHTTSAGTQGLANAVNASMILTGSLVNANAVASYIKSFNPENVSLVAMGYRACESADEDLLCAGHIASLLQGKSPVDNTRINDLRNTSGKRFFVRENIDFSPPTDFFLCTMLDRFNFVLKAERRSDGNIELFRIDI
ncbi:MAG TPA: 2-phosphosulfolactate phosphatase [Bacteroidales bacterium]|nr:2-phosphosulfolactate phosphatase [Bacteroidales bacterium]